MDMTVEPINSGPGRRMESPWSTDIGRSIRDRVEELVPMLRTTAVEGERLGALAPQSLAALSDLGLFKLTLPTDFGGYALGARDVVEIVSEVSRGDGAAGWSAFVAGGLRNMLIFSDEAVREILSEIDSWKGPIAAAASLFSPKVGSARRVDGGWMVSGSWHFGSGCKHAKWAGVGVEYATETGHVSRGMAVLEMGQVEIVDNWHVMGLQATSSNSLKTNQEQFVPDRRLIDMADFPQRMDESRKRYSGFASRFDGRGLMLITNLTCVSTILGMARGALEIFIEMAQQQRPFNLPYDSVAEMVSTQVCAAKAYGVIRSAEAVIYSAADLLDRYAHDGVEIPPELEQSMTFEAISAAHSLDDTVGMLQRTIGSSSANLKNPLQRFSRDIRVALLHGAIRLEPVAEIFGRHLMGVKPFPMFAGVLPDLAGLKPTAT